MGLGDIILIMSTDKLIVKVWRVVLIVVGAAMIGWIVWQYYGLSGNFTVTYKFDDASSFISRLGPIGRALDREQNVTSGDYYQRVISDPVYFSVNLPSPYPVIDVTMEYQNPAQQIVQLGVRLLDEDDSATAYQFQPLENKFVDNSDWQSLTNADYVLLQREPTYQSVDEFIAQPPAAAKVGTFLTTIDWPFQDETYVASDRNINITVPVRGAHKLSTYLSDEPLDFTFTYEDINYAAGEDSFNITVTYRGTELLSQAVTDDGDSGISGSSAGPRMIHIALPNPAAGVYNINLQSNDDIIFTRIQSPQDRLVFNKTIHLAGTAEYTNVIPDIVTTPATLYSNSAVLTAAAKHFYGIQTVKFYNTTLSLNRVDVPFVWRNPVWDYAYDVTFPNNDVYVTSDTFLAVDPAQWFDPAFGFRPLQQNTDLAQLDYIISRRYSEPERLRSWTTTSARFDLTKVARADPTMVDFILSAPGLETATGGIKIRRLTVTATKEPLTLKNLWTRLQKKLF